MRWVCLPHKQNQGVTVSQALCLISRCPKPCVFDRQAGGRAGGRAVKDGWRGHACGRTLGGARGHRSVARCHHAPHGIWHTKYKGIRDANYFCMLTLARLICRRQARNQIKMLRPAPVKTTPRSPRIVPARLSKQPAPRNAQHAEEAWPADPCCSSGAMISATADFFVFFARHGPIVFMEEAHLRPSQQAAEDWC